jgi:hypothetical protein
MGQGNLGNVIATEVEKLRSVLPLLYERDDLFLKMLHSRGDVEKVSARLMRLPLQLKPGGKSRAVNMDGGDMGRGGFTLYDFATVTPQFFAHAIEWSKLVQYSTDSSEKAIQKMVPREIKNGMAQFRAFLDKICQTAGNGVVGTISSISGQVLTLSASPGADLISMDQDLQIYDTTLTTNKGKITVAIVNILGKSITLDPSTPLPGGVIATDVLVYDGLSGAQPVGLFGIPYFQSNATTGTFLNMNRATYPVQLAAQNVNAANAALTPAQYMQAINFIRMVLGTEQAGGGGKASKLIAYLHPAQDHAHSQLGLTISNIIKEGGSGADDLDLSFTGKRSMYGAPIKQSRNAARNRIDFLDLSHWGRAEMEAIDFYGVGGQTNWPIYGGSGGLAAAEITYIYTGFQIWNDSPPSGAFISNLAIPAGY